MTHNGINLRKFFVSWLSIHETVFHSMDEKELVQQVVQHNNHEAFSILVERYKKMVITTCIGFLGNFHDAEDIAQDVFIELYESLPEFRNEAKLSTWIYRIAVNKSLNFLRRKKRETFLQNFIGNRIKGKTGLTIDEIMDKGNTDISIELKEQHKQLRHAMGMLPENQRIALVLSTYHELSYKEIAEVMETSVSSVESLLFRAKNNLRKIMGKTKP
ncbi:MAG TPA: RNA polymerase sigma factor [Bacteroidales bacterium]|nr:RNA polymerase sigma factor [Bacteroidales bacterium]